MNNITTAMKTTEQRLSEVYCRPTTSEEQMQLRQYRNKVVLSNDISIAVFVDGKVHNVIMESDWWRKFGAELTEIPVQHFIAGGQ
jgi:hypothetical protein